MLVTFETKSYANITMFGEVAVSLLKLMGHSGTVPGAIQASDIPDALKRLKAAIKEAATEAQADGPRDDDDEEEPVSLTHRALPLIELLESAAAAGCDVMWKK